MDSCFQEIFYPKTKRVVPSVKIPIDGYLGDYLCWAFTSSGIMAGPFIAKELLNVIEQIAHLIVKSKPVISAL